MGKKKKKKKAYLPPVTLENPLNDLVKLVIMTSTYGSASMAVCPTTELSQAMIKSYFRAMVWIRGKLGDENLILLGSSQKRAVSLVPLASKASNSSSSCSVVSL